MYHLSVVEKTMVEKELSTIVGEPLTDMWRYAGHQVFALGQQVEVIDEDSEEPIQVDDCCLIVYCEWEFRGPNGFLLSSVDFAGEQGRNDHHAHAFYNRADADPIEVEGLSVDFGGLVEILFTEGFSLTVRPSTEVEPWEAQWRFQVRRDDPRGQLLLEPNALCWSTAQTDRASRT